MPIATRQLEIHRDICVVTDVVPADICEEIITRFGETQSRIPSHVYNGSPAGGPRSGSVAVMEGPEWARHRDLLHEVARGACEAFAGQHPGLASLLQAPHVYTTPRVEEIHPGDGFDWHLDARQSPGDLRFLTLLFYLNDVEEGGETEFYYEGLKIRPRRGSLLMAPPYWTHLHRGCTPVSNTKYTVGLFVMREGGAKEGY